MAKIVLRVDADNQGDVNITDAKLLAQVNLAVSAWSGPDGGTPSEKLAFVAGKLKTFLLEVAKGEKRRQRQAAIEAQLAQDDADLSD